MNYNYYRERPGWGTQSYQFAPPPAPAFRPEPTWGGRDYYNAAAVSPDASIFDNTWNRVSGPEASTLGVGFHEARHWHRRAYGGLVDTSMMAPIELGAAAGYEAYRNFMHNSSIYEPLIPDDYRQREAIVGLAVAEATRLWHSTGRRMDRMGLQAACEVAGATASTIIGQWVAPDPYGNSSVSRASMMGGSVVGGSMVGGPTMMGGSMVGGPTMAGSMMRGSPMMGGSPMIGAPSIGSSSMSSMGGMDMDRMDMDRMRMGGGSVIGSVDPYADDDEIYRRRKRRNRRHSSVPRESTIINIGGGMGPQAFPGSGPMQIPGSTSIPYATLASAAGGYPASYTGGSTVNAGGYPSSVPMSVYGQNVAGFGAGTGMPLGGGVLNPMPASMQPAYQAQMAAAYPSAMPNIGGIVPGQTIGAIGGMLNGNGSGFGGGGGMPAMTVIPPPPRRHRHHSRERSRERDRDREEEREVRHERRRQRRYSDAAAMGGYVPGAAQYAQVPSVYRAY